MSSGWKRRSAVRSQVGYCDPERGLGPTKDDLTKEVTAQVFDMELLEDPHTRARIQEYFDQNYRGQITENNWKQAQVPEGSMVIDNYNGTRGYPQKDGRQQSCCRDRLTN